MTSSFAGGTYRLNSETGDVDIMVNAVPVLKFSNVGVEVMDINNPGESLSSLTSSGLKRRNIDSQAYTVLPEDGILSVKYTQTGSVTITLPESNTVVDGNIVHIVDSGGNAFINNISILLSGSDTINGESSTLVNRNFQSLSLYGCGVDNCWVIY